MPKSYPREFRDDVVRVVRNREPGVTRSEAVELREAHQRIRLQAAWPQCVRGCH